jgi:hypothetical protein
LIRRSLGLKAIFVIVNYFRSFSSHVASRASVGCLANTITITIQGECKECGEKVEGMELEWVECKRKPSLESLLGVLSEIALGSG